MGKGAFDFGRTSSIGHTPVGSILRNLERQTAIHERLGGVSAPCRPSPCATAPSRTVCWGCLEPLGRVSYRVVRAHLLGDEMIRRLNALADYAFYCGTGHHTTRGMGQTRRVRGGERPVARAAASENVGG